LGQGISNEVHIYIRTQTEREREKERDRERKIEEREREREREKEIHRTTRARALERISFLGNASVMRSKGVSPLELGRYAHAPSSTSLPAIWVIF